MARVRVAWRRRATNDRWHRGPHCTAPHSFGCHLAGLQPSVSQEYYTRTPSSSAW